MFMRQFMSHRRRRFLALGCADGLVVPTNALCLSPGQNSTGQNATNSGICFSFLQMLFQFVAACTQCSSKLREEKKNRINIIS